MIILELKKYCKSREDDFELGFESALKILKFANFFYSLIKTSGALLSFWPK